MEFFDIAKELTAFAVVLAAFAGGVFVGIPRAFRYHEARLKELSEEYRARELEQEERHRKEMREVLDQFCESLRPIAERLGSLEQKIDRFTA